MNNTAHTTATDINIQQYLLRVNLHKPRLGIGVVVSKRAKVGIGHLGLTEGSKYAVSQPAEQDRDKLKAIRSKLIAAQKTSEWAISGSTVSPFQATEYDSLSFARQTDEKTHTPVWIFKTLFGVSESTGSYVRKLPKFCSLSALIDSDNQSVASWKPLMDAITIDPALDGQYLKAKSRIVQLCGNQIDANAPNSNVKQKTLDALKLLKKYSVLPSLINSTGDESLLFEFFINENSYSLDFYNSGEIVYLRRIKGQIADLTEIDTEQLKEAVSEIALAYDRAIL